MGIVNEDVGTFQQRDRVCPFGYDMRFSEALKKACRVPLHQDKRKKMKLLLTFTITLLLVLSTGCNNRDNSEKESNPAAGGMKCGAGKCGANMFDGNAALVKKKKNVTIQMRDDDPRRDCVAKASSTKAVYDCVRDPKTGMLSKKCGEAMKETSPSSAMKCGAGKCGADMPKPEPKPAMKCGAGKCGSM